MQFLDKIHTVFTAALSGRKKTREKRNMHITQAFACGHSVEPSRQWRDTFNDSGVTGIVVLLVQPKLNVRHQHPKGESEKTGLIDFLRSTQFAVVLNEVSL